MKPLALFLVVCGFASACGSPSDTGSAKGERATVLVEIPPTAGIPARVCSEAAGYFVATAVNDREEWYGKHLRALDELPLCRGVSTPEVYRLTWLPSFHPAVVVRIERISDGYRLIAKTESGAGGDKPGHLARDTSVALGESVVRDFSSLLTAAHFWTLPTYPPPDGTRGLDGAQWIVEGQSRGRYHVVDRWSPRVNGPDARYRQLVEWMLARSGLAAPARVRGY